MPGLNFTPSAPVSSPPPPPPIVLQPLDSDVSPPVPVNNTPSITLLEDVVETTVSAGPGDTVEVTLRCKFVYIIEGYGIVPFVWEEVCKT